MNGKKAALKAALYVVFMLLLYFFQASVFPRIRIFGVKPLFIPVAAVCIGMFEGSLLGGALGLVCGILCDFCMADTAVMFTVFLTIVGFACGQLSETVLRCGFPSCIVCSAAVSLLCAFLQSFELLFFKGESSLLLLKVGLLQAVYSVLFVLPIYLPVRAISRSARS